MKKSSERIRTAGEFFRLLRQVPQSRYLAFENLLTGGLSWRIRAWYAERRLAKVTQNQFEASGDEFDAGYKKWQDLDCQARFGKPLSDTGRSVVRRLVDSGTPEPKIRTWIVNGHMDEDGNLMPRYRRIADRIVRALAWVWHGLVVTTAVLFVVYAWSLPGPTWKKVAATVGVLLFFLIMSALMNSTSLSALPPREKRLES
tara:strand:+ start:6349 stop:6951 length:603 start_codon:yes stop_codon:yes gene_type:complete